VEFDTTHTFDWRAYIASGYAYVRAHIGAHKERALSRVIGGIVISGVVVAGVLAPKPHRPSPSTLEASNLPAMLDHAPHISRNKTVRSESVPAEPESPRTIETPSPEVSFDMPDNVSHSADTDASPQPADAIPEGFTVDRLVESAIWGRYVLEPRAAMELPLVEIVAFDARTKRLFATSRDGLAVIDLSDVDSPKIVTIIDVANDAGFAQAGASLSHVSIDPAGRDVAIVTVLPANKSAEPGRLAFVSLTRLEVIGSVLVGYGPDAAEFSPDGSVVVVANEGEWEARADGTIDDPPPSVSIVSLNAVNSEWHFESVTQSDVRTVHFSGPAMRATTHDGPMDPDRDLRLSESQRYSPGIDIEPESVTIIGGKAYVSLQENNGIAMIDLRTGELERIASLGSMMIRADVSDRDGPALSELVRALPMPDQLKAFTANNAPYIITANEGDNRGELGKDEPKIGRAHV